MKIAARVALIAIASGLCGYVWDVLAWRFHLPYPAINWLGPLIGADGEAGYAALMYETMINFFLVFCLVYLLIWKLSKRTRAKEA